MLESLQTREEIRCPNRNCGTRDEKTGHYRGRLLGLITEHRTGTGFYEIEIRCRGCKTMVRIIFSESEIIVKAA